jgi:hypothetical protein
LGRKNRNLFGKKIELTIDFEKFVIKVTARDVVSVGAVGAIAPTVFEDHYNDTYKVLGFVPTGLKERRLGKFPWQISKELHPVLNS